MAGTKGDNDMSSNAGSRLLRGERDIFDQGFLTRGWSQRGGDEKLSVDFDRAWLQGTTVLPGRGVVVVLRKQHFLRARLHWSLRKRLIIASGIPVGLLAFVSATVVLVPM